MAEEEQKQHKEQPIIIKKIKKGGHAGHHGGAWKVAYADFVTAMMAFFIVMWILGQSEEVKKQVEAYFQDPGAFNFVTGKRTIPIDLDMRPSGDGPKDGKGEGDNKSKNDFYFFLPPEKDTIMLDKAEEKKRLEATTDSIKAAEQVKKTADEINKFLNEEMSRRPELQDILSSIKIEMTKEGLRIELIESKDALFFEIGSAKISEKARNVLIQLAKEIGKLPNYVELEGHTDSRQYSKQALYTNWELSADRANSSRRLLEQSGLWDSQIVRVTGFADKHLRNPENPFDMSNRRISILIKQLKIDDFLSASSQQETNME
ncbi:MAG TPA: flagellar motor protein MotB [Candidatus Kapabacteria bacterium]|nr:flagellar motor protein MotB [Candidatus Kapabacteria bacterium]